MTASDLDIDGLGVVRSERVRAGAFDIFRGELHGADVAIKLPGAGPPDPAFLARHSVVFSRLLSAYGRAGTPAPPPPPAEQLAREAARIRATRGTWNHDVIAAARVRRPDGSHDLGLVMPWHPGPTLAELPAPERRLLLPRMLPALWRALAAAIHGDLHGGNIILAPARDRFALIDPAAFIVDEHERHGDSTTRCTFTTHPRYYPLLPPYYAPSYPLSAAPALAAQFDAFRWALSGCCELGPGSIAGGATTVFAELPEGRAEPGPADLLAVGVLYYEALTGAHPFEDAEFTAPGWLGVVACDGFRAHDSGLDAALARIARPVVPPAARASDIGPAESELATALLELRVHDEATLHRLAVAAALTAAERVGQVPRGEP